MLKKWKDLKNCKLCCLHNVGRHFQELRKCLWFWWSWEYCDENKFKGYRKAETCVTTTPNFIDAIGGAERTVSH